MFDRPIGLSTGLFYHRSFFDCVEKIRKSGFNIIEICSSKQHLDYHNRERLIEAGRLASRLKLEIYSFHAPFGENIDITSLDRKIIKHSRHEINRAIEAAALLKAKYFVFHPGPEKPFSPPAHKRLKRMEMASNTLNEIYKRCSDAGLSLVLENLLPHLFCGNLNEMLWMVGSIKAKEVGTCLDTGHAFLAGNLIEMTHKLSSLKLIHINDNNGSSDEHLPPPLGKIDWLSFLDELNFCRFSGVLMLELAAGNKECIDESFKKAANARHYLQELAHQRQL